jgi:hypothetical protein
LLLLLRRRRPEPRLRADARYWGHVQGYGGWASNESADESADDGGEDFWLPFLLKIGANSFAACRTLIPTGMILILTPRVHYLNSRIVTIAILPLEQGNPDITRRTGMMIA